MSTKTFSNLYQKWGSRGNHLYPTEFVVRTMLGTYPRHTFGQSWTGSAVLDLGFGDGRNFPLLINLGCSISGVEVTEEALPDLK